MITALPTEKTPPSLSAKTSKGLLYGPPKVGKTTLISMLYPESTLLLATEPGTGGIDAYVTPITSWAEFVEVYKLLKAGKHEYSTIAIDTIDELHRMCQAQVMADLKISHPSDLEWGKGWQAVGDKFRLGIGAIAGLGLGVWFVSHSKDVEIEERIGKRTKTVPSLGGQGRDFILGFVDHILYATVEQTEAGQRRIIHTAPNEAYEAGSRADHVQDADPVPLAADVLRELLEAEVPLAVAS